MHGQSQYLFRTCDVISGVTECMVRANTSSVPVTSSANTGATNVSDRFTLPATSDRFTLPATSDGMMAAIDGMVVGVRELTIRSTRAPAIIPPKRETGLQWKSDTEAHNSVLTIQ
jgi:hypothetical protein